MDSLSSPNKATRDFIFPAFKEVVEKSDGALSEVVGLYAIKYVEGYPKEFAERYSCCLAELSQLTNYIGYEIMMSQEPTSEYKQLFETINQKYPKYEQDKSMRAFKEKLETYMQSLLGKRENNLDQQCLDAIGGTRRAQRPSNETPSRPNVGVNR
ncbi:hypothetical protein GCM10027293_36570 [Pontibacter aydingkolensis]